MRIVQITGFLGAGKTTFLTALASELERRGHRVAVIVNDVGHINVDQKVMTSRGLEVKEVSGGCICCEVQGTFTTTVVNLHLGYKPDIILVEPTGVAIPWGLKRAVEEASKNSGLVLEHAPIITFVDGQTLQERLMFVGRLVTTQIQEADAVMISKIDLCSDDDVRYCVETISSINPDIPVLKGSAVTGQGMDDAVDMILNGISKKYNESVEAGIFKEQYGVKN